MKALSLFGLCVLAKAAILAGHQVAGSIWMPVAYIWQDALVALLFGAIEVLTRRTPWVSWLLYGTAVLYVAINVPLTRIVSSPLTWQMGRAARGALADSITHYLTVQNIGLIAFFVLAGILLPFLMTKIPGRARKLAAVLGIICVAAGPGASRRIETIGLHRNAFVAFVCSTLPRLGAERAEDDWRRSPFVIGRATGGSSEALSRLHGAAIGRNVVMVHLESTGARYLHHFGAAEDPMPNLTRLAQRAVIFENACAVCPESIKGLFSVLCSRYPAFDVPAEDCARIRTQALGQVLAKHGYQTALFHSRRFLYLGMHVVIQNRGYQIMEDAGAISGNFHSSFGADEPATVQRILAWIDSVPRARKFFITYLPIAGHHPYDSPEGGPFPESSEIGRYRNALHYGDQALGVFLEGLRSRGLDTNTVFVLFGDHGEAFGQHEGNYGHTLFIHDENVHVPLLVAAPGLLTEQVRVPRVASLIDLAPTVLDLLDLPAPDEYQGRSLVNSDEQMALFYTDYSLGLLGLRDGGWKCTYELESKHSALFDLTADPGETNNLAARFPERVQFYQVHLQRWSEAQRELILRPVDAL